MRFRSMIVGALVLAAPAAAQNSLPGLSNFTLETRPTPQPTPTPNAATPSPAPGDAPSPAASRTPRPAATTRPASTATPSVRPSGSAAAAPVVVFTPVAATPAPVVTAPAATAAVVVTTPAWPAWLIPIAVIGLLAWAGVAWLWWRRRRPDAAPRPIPAAVESAPSLPTPVEPVAPPPPPAAPRAPGGLVTTALRPAIELSMTPVAAGIDTLRATLDFQLTIRNTGRATAHETVVETWLFGAGTDPMADRNAALTQPLGEPMLPPFDLPAAANADLTGQVAAAREALATINAGERKLFVPMLVVRVGWRDQAGQSAALGVAFLIGTERPGQERLVPLALDRGAREFRTLAARLLDR